MKILKESLSGVNKTMPNGNKEELASDTNREAKWTI